MPMPCLCAGLSLVAMDMCTPCHVVELLVPCVFVLFAYGASLQAGWETMCLFVAITSLPRHGHNAKHGPFSHVLVIFVEL